MVRRYQNCRARVLIRDVSQSTVRYESSYTYPKTYSFRFINVTGSKLRKRQKRKLFLKFRHFYRHEVLSVVMRERNDVLRYLSDQICIYTYQIFVGIRCCLSFWGLVQQRVRTYDNTISLQIIDKYVPIRTTASCSIKPAYLDDFLTLPTSYSKSTLS